MTSLKSMALIAGLLAASVLSNQTPAAAQDSYIISRDPPVVERVVKMKLSFKPEFTHREVVDIGPSGPSIDDGIGGNGILRDLSGKQIGRFDTIHRHTGFEPDGDMRLVFAEYTFGDGRDSLLIAGAELFQKSFGLIAQHREHLYGIAAGTGKFAGARGECSVKRTVQVEYIVNCVLTVPEH
jgi:hypothetical protein